MNSQHQIDLALARLDVWVDNYRPGSITKADAERLLDHVSCLLNAYRILRQRETSLSAVLIEGIARGVELRAASASTAALRVGHEGESGA
jgi:hypothetical protein